MSRREFAGGWWGREFGGWTFVTGALNIPFRYVVWASVSRISAGFLFNRSRLCEIISWVLLKGHMDAPALYIGQVLD